MPPCHHQFESCIRSWTSTYSSASTHYTFKFPIHCIAWFTTSVQGADGVEHDLVLSVWPVLTFLSPKDSIQERWNWNVRSFWREKGEKRGWRELGWKSTARHSRQGRDLLVNTLMFLTFWKTFLILSLFKYLVKFNWMRITAEIFTSYSSYQHVQV